MLKLSSFYGLILIKPKFRGIVRMQAQKKKEKKSFLATLAKLRILRKSNVFIGKQSNMHQKYTKM